MRFAQIKVASGLNKRCFDHAVKTVKSMDGEYNPETRIWNVCIDDTFDEGVMSDPEYYGLVVIFESSAVETIVEQIEQIENTTTEEIEMPEITVTAEMVVAGTAPALSFGTYPELHDNETITVNVRDEERHSLNEFRALYPELCCDEDGNALPDSQLTPVIPASTYIIASNSPRLNRFWAEQEG